MIPDLAELFGPRGATEIRDALPTSRDPLDYLFLGHDGLETLSSADGAWLARLREGGAIVGFRDGVTDAGLERWFGRFGWKVTQDGPRWIAHKQRLAISYIMPAYLCESTIVDAVESIAGQSLGAGDEVVIVNDASPDATGARIDELRRRFGFIRVVEHKRNRGGAAARNTAVEHASNALIFCLDSDNILEPESVDALSAYLQSTGSDAAAFQQLRYFVAAPGDGKTTWTFRPGVVTLGDAMAGFVVPPSSGNYLFTRDSWIAAGGYPEFAGALDAWGFGIRQLGTGSRMVVLPHTWYHHRHGHESYWLRFTRSTSASLVALQIVLPFIDQFEEDDVDYMLGPSGRHTWLENLDSHPIRVRTGGAGAAGVAAGPSATLFSRVKRFARWFH